MGKRPALAKSELEVAQIVWKRGRATVREVFEAMPSDRDLDIKTVQTYLRRLEAKGYVRAYREGRNNVYAPRVSASRVVRRLVDDFVNRIFDGQPFPLVQQLLEHRGLTDEEIDRLQGMLNDLKKPS